MAFSPEEENSYSRLKGQFLALALPLASVIAAVGATTYRKSTIANNSIGDIEEKTFAFNPLSQLVVWDLLRKKGQEDWRLMTSTVRSCYAEN
jgi:hypothetical protein